jgi:hypothetical protein
METEVGRVHHVAWCVYGENLERVRAYWEHALGLTMVDIELPERGLHVLLAWDAGIEVIAPTAAGGGGAAAVNAFLAERGEGVYAIVYSVAPSTRSVRVSSARGPSSSSRRRCLPTLCGSEASWRPTNPRSPSARRSFATGSVWTSASKSSREKSTALRPA